jgi:hypothetical protein
MSRITLGSYRYGFVSSKRPAWLFVEPDLSARDPRVSAALAGGR